MPKLKTHKMTAARIKPKKKAGFMSRNAGQDHFNAKESGKKTRNKRGHSPVADCDAANIKRSLPYS